MSDAVPGRDDRTMIPGARVLEYCLAILSATTAVTHFAVAGAHFREYWAFGLFMLVVAWLQVLWAAAVVISPARWLLWAGVIVDAAVIAVYIGTRTAGDVVGPAPRAVESVGFGDVLCTTLEAIVVAGCLWLLVRARDRWVPRKQLVIVPAVTGTAAAALLSVALVAGGPEMVMTAAAGTASSGTQHGMRMSAPTAAAIRLPTASPGGDITMPDPNMQMAAGMQMASPTMCDTVPTAAQQEAAVRLVDTSWQDASGFRSLAAEKAAGYVPITPRRMARIRRSQAAA